MFQGFDMQELTSLRMATPIENILPLVHDLLGQDVQNEGTMMKVLGHPVGILKPGEGLLSVVLFRGGRQQQSVSAEELTDPEHLEQFLELEENDVVRVNIFPQHSDVNSIFYYEINVSTGEVSPPTPLF